MKRGENKAATRVGATNKRQQSNITILAGHIAGILANPETPSSLDLHIVDTVTEWESDYINEHRTDADFIEACFRAHKRKEAKRQKGTVSQ